MDLMNRTAKLLDCTLRDGAYLVNKQFGDATIKGMIAGLQQAKIDYIEIGFLQDEGFGDGKTVYLNAAQAKKFVPEDKKGCLFTVLADYSRYSIEHLDLYDGTSFDAVRACFFKQERFDVIPFCKEIKEKGYQLFVQPVDILGYSDAEILDFLNRINEIEPDCLSIVDTFGSMYHDDLERVFSLIDHNLADACQIGFHSHNNMQMSSSLSQNFLKIAQGKRNVVIDATVLGMGRGAGNTPTELIVQYMVQKLGYFYDLDAILDLIDIYMKSIKSRCSWGYSAPYFIAGCFSAHVNNIAYLTEKNSIRSKDIRYILNKIGSDARKRYDYELLEKTYMDYVDYEIDDSDGMQRLKTDTSGKHILFIAPGTSVAEASEDILNYIKQKDPVSISINFIPELIPVEFIYFSNRKRYEYWKNKEELSQKRKILASNMIQEIREDKENNLIISFRKLIKCGWQHIDNSTLMLLRLFDELPVASIAIAGFDGYLQNGAKDYAVEDMEVSDAKENAITLNSEIKSMLKEFFANRTSDYPIELITRSKFEDIFHEYSKR